MPIGKYDPLRARHRTAGVVRDAEGHPVCVHCGERLEGRGRRWHPECVEDHKLRSGGRETRRAVEMRDRGVCALCGLDCVALAERMKLALREAGVDDSMHYQKRGAIRSEIAHRLIPERPRIARALSLGNHIWEADHIVPKAEGGAYTDLNNLRTLCKTCHAVVTGNLRRRLNRAKRTEARTRRREE